MRGDRQAVTLTPRERRVMAYGTAAAFHNGVVHVCTHTAVPGVQWEADGHEALIFPDPDRAVKPEFSSR